MKRDDYIDFHLVRPEHERIHGALLNWSRWCSSRSGTPAHPMWRWCKPPQHWHPVTHSVPVDGIRAQRVEKEVAKLPAEHAMALRWSYVYQTPPRKAARNLAVSLRGLMDLVADGRTMLRNRMGDGIT